MELVDHLRVLRRRWPLVIGAPLVALIVALVVTIPSIRSAQNVSSRYDATHVLYQASAQDAMPLSTIALLASNGQIQRQVVEALGGGSEVAARVSDVVVAADDKLRILTLTATSTDPRAAERLVDVYAERILAYLEGDAGEGDQAADNLERQREQLANLDDRLADLAPGSETAAELREQRDDLLQRIGRTTERVGTQDGASVPTGGLRTVQPGTAVVAVTEGFQAPTTPGPRLLLATLMGLLIGVALAFVIDRADATVRTRKDAEAAFGVPVLAEVPRSSRRSSRKRAVVTTTRPGSMAAEAYRGLRLGVQVMPRWRLRRSVEPGSVGELMAIRLDANNEVDGDRGQVVLVSSPGAGEGKTTTVANLAASFAEINKTVLLLDCDFRSPRLAAAMEVEPGTGCAEYLRPGAQQPALADLAKPTFIPNVWLVPSGKAVGNPGELIGPDTDLLREAASLADVVVVDVGPLLAVHEGATLAPLVDAVVLVARVGQTRIDHARLAGELVARTEAAVSGTVLVGVTAADLGSRYYYGGYGSRSATNGHKPKVFPQQPQVIRS